MSWKLKIIRYCIVMACIGLAPFPAQATLISYNITGTVTAAPESPGSYSPDTDYNFGVLPSSFAGTFMADDTVAGPISALSLAIGGVNVAAFGLDYSNFDPGTLTLDLSLCCGVSDGAAVVLGANTPWDPMPANRIVAIQDETDGPVVDPYLGYDQNWVGTFSVAKTPEPATLALFGLGLAVLGFSSRRKRASL